MKRQPTLENNLGLISGFSLIEMAIVLVVLGLALGGLLAPLSQQLDNAARTSTKKDMVIAKEALLGFAMSNGRLPCPDTNGDGQEDLNNKHCVRYWGDLPFHELAVNNKDAWGRPFRYLVDTKFADLEDGTACGLHTPAAGVSFEMCSVGNLNIVDASAKELVAGLPVIILSYGKNWNTTPSSAQRKSELKNWQATQTKVMQKYSHSDKLEYDDLLEWVSPNILKNKMVDAGKLP